MVEKLTEVFFRPWAGRLIGLEVEMEKPTFCLLDENR
jgi:hypothetical protein